MVASAVEMVPVGKPVSALGQLAYHPAMRRSLARCTVPLCALLLAGCGASEGTPSTPVPPPSGPGPATPPATPVSPPCPAGSSDALVMSYAVHGTHGMDFSETLTIACSGEVVLDAPRPWTTELAERPGRYTHRLDAARVEQLRALAVRLAQPVPVPSLPPQGADVTVFVYTSPPASHELRPEGPADGEAAAMMSAITSEIVAALPPLVRCDLNVELTPSAYPLVAGGDSMVLVTLTNPADHAIHVAFPVLSEAIEINTPVGNAMATGPEAIAMFMLSDMTGIGSLSEAPSVSIPTAVEIPAHAAPFAAVHVLFPTAAPLTARARVRARVSCGAPTPEDDARPWRTYESPEVTLVVTESAAP